MRYVQPAPDLSVSSIALGCMRISQMENNQVRALIETSLESGVNFFDHADIYGKGQSEVVFGKALKSDPGLREKILIQSKCGIRTGFYDSSKEHILTSVDNILLRLDTPYLDVLLIHRPDALAEPQEMAEAFAQLKTQGKVRYFGVSNHNPAQMAALQQAAQDKLLFNQLQISLMHTPMVDQGINVNTQFDGAVDRDGSLLAYCKQQGVTVQAWSPFQFGFIKGVFLSNPAYPELNKALLEMADKYEVSIAAIAAAWILRLPVQMQVVVGTTTAARVQDVAKAADITLSREDWYALYRAAGNKLP